MVPVPVQFTITVLDLYLVMVPIRFIRSDFVVQVTRPTASDMVYT